MPTETVFSDVDASTTFELLALYEGVGWTAYTRDPHTFALGSQAPSASSPHERAINSSG